MYRVNGGVLQVYRVNGSVLQVYRVNGGVLQEIHYGNCALGNSYT